MLIRVHGPEFTAGLVLDEYGPVIRAAPILQWAIGLSADEARLEQPPEPHYGPSRSGPSSRACFNKSHAVSAAR